MNDDMELVLTDGAKHRQLTRTEKFVLLPDKRRTKTAQELMQNMYENQMSLLCHCIRPPALMFTKHYTHKAHYYGLVCHASKGIHHRNCPHYRVVSGSIVHDKKRLLTAISQQEQVFDELSLFGSFDSSAGITTAKQNGDVRHYHRQNSGIKVPKLVCLTRFLIRKSGQNIISNNGYYNGTCRGALEAIRNAADSINFGPEGDTLKEWIFWGERGYKMACQKLYRTEDAGTWRENSRPHAIVLAIANEIKLNREDKSNKSISIDDAPPIFVQRIITEGVGVKDKSSPEKGGTNGPFLILYSLCRANKKNKYRPHTVFIKPIISNNRIMPVDSNYERSFAKQAAYMLLKGEGNKLEKPLTGQGIDGCYLLPDFLIKANGQEHLVEVMGMLGNPEYVTRKEYIVPLMHEAWPNHKVIELDPNDTDPSSESSFKNYINNLEQIVTDMKQ
ncbi:hypothetical protein A1QO_06240 [Vibrio genomosp. F10 str. ZF-129]|uniref:DUF1173 domain-containing protein n=1 Tax=Vibrio genomosp. F10 str. ZF-129 TaxID=1187848 RepID=A0A1E5BG33_9VIBR|nr:hypothetical protein [Vibrio genomosp. F10]OEE34981.1 hypothetical protein A1QO_06240 [Vibrio genomosp. F10 str. ZF-129]